MDYLRFLGWVGQTYPRKVAFFGRLSVEETSSVLGVSPDTVKRDWATAKI
jgi:hypothetical protein